jgi:hypothetical protein
VTKIAVRRVNQAAASRDIVACETLKDRATSACASPLPRRFNEPDDVSIAAAIEANDTFIDRLKAISEAAQGHTLDQDD